MGELHRWDKGRRRISWEQREAGEALASGSKLLVLHGFLIILLRLCQPDSIQLLRWCKCFVRVLKNQDLEDNLRFRTSQTSVFPFKSLSRFNSLPNKDALSAVTKIKIAPMNCLAAAFLYFRCYSC